MSTNTQPAPDQSHHHEEKKVLQVILFAHSALFYWWPLWVAGYVMALLTWRHHEAVDIGGKPEWFYPSRNLGAVYAYLFLLLILITSSRVRGFKAALIVVALSFVALLFAYLEWWDPILDFLGEQHLYLNFGFCMFTSTALFAIWFVTVFIIDRLSFWRFRPGQVTHEYVWGIVDKSYDTDNMVMMKRQDEFFRHWVIGLGSGDLHLQTMGGRGVEMNVENLLFVGHKMSRIEKLIATVPDVPQQA